MKTANLLYVVSALWVVSSVSGARILALFPYVGKSHFDVFEPLVKRLAARGHQLVVLSHFPQKEPVANYTDISLVGSVSVPTKDRIDMENVSGFEGVKTLYNEIAINIESCNKILSFHAVKNLFKSKESFDLVITETFFPDCLLPFVHKFKGPNIALSSSPLLPWSSDRMGNGDNPSYVPTIVTGFSDNMSFIQRLFNFITNIALKVFFNVVDSIVIQEFVRTHFGNDVPDLATIARNTSLILVNSFFGLNRPRPLVPGIVEVGGLHIKPYKKLPKEIEDYLNEAEHGVIYFSMGSMLRGETFPTDKRNAFLQAFSELPQRVLWKWEGDTMPEQIKNVKISKWLPQFDILNHPNVRVFVGHGGLLSTIEAVYTGVPMVGIPIFGDQPLNIKAIVSSGMAVHLDFKDITKENVLKALRAVLDEPSYRKNAQLMSKIYKDRPMSAMDTAVYWTEYVIRHGGAPHMRPAGMDLAWYQYLLLDVIAVFALFFVSILFFIRFLTRKFVRIFISRFPKMKSKQS